jgi:hypothetical protein
MAYYNRCKALCKNGRVCRKKMSKIHKPYCSTHRYTFKLSDISICFICSDVCFNYDEYQICKDCNKTFARYSLNRE